MGFEASQDLSPKALKGGKAVLGGSCDSSTLISTLLGAMSNYKF